MNTFLHNKYTPFLGLAISGLCLLISFAPIQFWPLGFFILFPVLYILENLDFNKTKIKYVILLGIMESIFISIFSYHWVLHTMNVFGNLPYIVAFPIFILYAIGTNLRWILFFLLSFLFLRWRFNTQHETGWLHNILQNRYVSLPAIWGIAEYFGWQLFPYYGINLVSSNLFFVQIVDVVGTYGGSVIWFILSLSIFDMICQKRFSLYGCSLAFACHVYGFGVYEYWSNKQEQFPKKIIGVPQGNTPLTFVAGRNIYEQLQDNATRMVNLSRELLIEAKTNLKSVELLIWPESAIPFVTYSTTPYLQEGVKSLHVDMPPFELIQNDISSEYKNGLSVSHSNMSIINSDAIVTESYQKIKLLPFGEYLPLSQYFESYKRAFAEVSNFEFGERYVLFPSQVGKVMPLICYEAIIPDFVWSFFNKTNQEAQLMVNITNDAWFGNTIETYEHLELVRLRSIEFRTPTVRATNSGVTTWFDIVGRNYDETSLYTVEKKIYAIPIPPSGRKTIYSILGNKPLYSFLFLYIMAWFIHFILKFTFINKKVKFT